MNGGIYANRQLARLYQGSQVPQEIISSGTTYYVDGNISTSGDGSTWDEAFKTVAEAIAVCDDDYTDDAEYYVFIAPGEYAEDDLLFAGHGLHLIGLGNPGNDSGVHIKGASGATYGVLAIAGANCSVRNIALEAAGAEPCLYLAAADNCVFDNIVFTGVSATTVSAVEIKTFKTCKMTNCTFGQAGNGFLTQVIYFTGAADTYFIDSEISNNKIYNTATASYGIYCASGTVTYGSVIKDNHISMRGAGTSARAIYLAPTNSTCFVTDNFMYVDSGGTSVAVGSGMTGVLRNEVSVAGTRSACYDGALA